MDSNSAGNLRQIFMLLTLLVGGVALESQVSLKASRPVNKTQIHYDRLVSENVDARLWGDPFGAVFQHQKKVKPSNLKEEISKKSLDKLLKNRKKETITLMGVLVSSGPYFVDAENRRRTRYAVLSGLAASGYRPEDSDHIGYLTGGDETYYTTEVLKKSTPPILPYEWFSRNKKDSKGKSIKDSKGKLVQEHVLVLWLDDYHYRNKGNDEIKEKEELNLIYELFTDLNKTEENQLVRYQLIGPTGSTDLVRMVKDVNQLVGENSKMTGPTLEIYSTRATKDEELILELAPRPLPKAKKPGEDESSGSESQESSTDAQQDDSSSKATSINELFKKREVNAHFLRTTPTDYHLAKALVRELQLRGIESDSDVALISEWDTDYGRAFKDTICKAWIAFNWDEGKFEEKRVDIDKPSKECKDLNNIHYFSYLRGLDGEIPESPSSDSKKNTNSKSPGSKEEKVDFSSLRAEKERQYDYLLRLTERIEETEKKFEGKDELLASFRTIHFEAFGVLGSDYYDKLVVLQALRNKFEHAQFFTTDMDARLFHPEDFKHVRNLIVASGFGLRLQDDLQQSIPPFRDTYQTSAYLATLLAVESDSCKQKLTQEKLDQWLQPRVFEIGRTHAFDLSFEGKLKNESICFKGFKIPVDNKFSLHPKTAQSIPSYKLPAVRILVLALILLVCLRIKEYWKWVLSGALIMTGFMALTFHLGTEWNQEPMAFFEGVSIWPTDFIRLIAILMTVAVICWYSGNPFSSKSKGKLKKNWDDISHDFMYSKVEATNKWTPCERGAFWKKVMWRAALFVGLAFLILGTFGFPFTPYRGGTSFWMDKFILIAFIISFAISLHYSGVHLNDSIKLLKNFKGMDLKWPDAVKKKIFTDAIPGAAAQTPSSPPDIPDSMKAMLNGPISLRFMAQRTDAVDELIYFPFAILTLGVLSRARVFDNWDFPFGLAALFIYGALYVLFKALQVQREAKKRKSELIEQLETQRIYYQAHRQDTEGGFLKLLIENTHDFKQGAFMPLADHPFYRALLLPFSGFGAMALLEYMFLAV